MELSPATWDIVKIAAGAIIGFAIKRSSKRTDDDVDTKVRLAVQAEQIQSLTGRMAVYERNEATQWGRIEKLGGGRGVKKE